MTGGPQEPEGFGADPVWERKYRDGHEQRYPWDVVVSFVFRGAPRDRARAGVRVLEVGCGTGANLRFAAREGFAVAGIDASATAIATARRRFDEAGLEGDLRVGGFDRLPFDDASFDLAIDRAALTCAGRSVVQRAVAEVNRVLRPGGRFLFNPYGAGHTSEAAGRPIDDGLVTDISAGTLTGVGQIHFVSREEIDDLFVAPWKLLSVQRLEIVETLNAEAGSHVEWRVIATKAAPG